VEHKGLSILKDRLRILFAGHIEASICSGWWVIGTRRRLEGIAVKRRVGAYGEDWFRIRNPQYSQYEGAA